MMATIFNSSILNSAILDSAILHKTLTQTSSIWLKLIHSDSTWWWQPSWMLLVLPSWTHSAKISSHICTKNLHSFILTQLDDGSFLEFWHLGFSHFVQKELHSFILTQLDDISHLELCHPGFRHCHLGFRHLVIFSQIHSKIHFLHSEPDSN